jgi:predicted transcriptional regulator of viral defense system
MSRLDRPYYVGLLSAAAVHGAAHQRAQVFQVVTDVPMRPIRVARLRIEFHRSRNIADAPTTRIQTETGSMRVSTPEATALDLLRYPAACGYLSNVATVLIELAELLDPQRLAKLVARGRHPEAQRLGYLLDRLGLERLAKPLATIVASWRQRPVLLRPERPAGGLKHDPRWCVIANEEVAPDL